MWDDQAQDSLTEEWRAIGLFTDRGPALRHFMEYVQSETPPQRILYFLGDGGHGKTLLLRYLRDHCWGYRVAQGNCPPALPRNRT